MALSARTPGRLAARALVSDPPLIVADEPTGDLDQESARKILELLKYLCTELGKTVVKKLIKDSKPLTFGKLMEYKLYAK